MTKRVQAKGWFLTYPKCDLTKEGALDLIMACIPGTVISQYVIARE